MRPRRSAAQLFGHLAQLVGLAFASLSGLAGLERAELHFGVYAGPVVFPAGIAKVQWSKRAWLAAGVFLALPSLLHAGIYGCSFTPWDFSI